MFGRRARTFVNHFSDIPTTDGCVEQSFRRDAENHTPEACAPQCFVFGIELPFEKAKPHWINVLAGMNRLLESLVISGIVRI
jgi:hypothetical protein